MRLLMWEAYTTASGLSEGMLWDFKAEEPSGFLQCNRNRIAELHMKRLILFFTDQKTGSLNSLKAVFFDKQQNLLIISF
jgi:hypothetical protein